MNTEAIAARIQSELGPDWPRIKPIPLSVLTPLCEALWDERQVAHPEYSQGVFAGNEHAGAGAGGGRMAQGEGLSQMGRGTRAPVATELRMLPA